MDAIRSTNLGRLDQDLARLSKFAISSLVEDHLRSQIASTIRVLGEFNNILRRPENNPKITFWGMERILLNIEVGPIPEREYEFRSWLELKELCRRCHDTIEILMQGLLEILDHPYWKRVWIIQEIVLARTIHVVQGQQNVSWEHMMQLPVACSYH